MYFLHPKGISSKTTLTINFMKKKMEEYDELRNELGNNKKMYTNEETNQKKIDYDLL